MQRLYVLVGLPGTGKSTFAHMLKETLELKKFGNAEETEIISFDLGLDEVYSNMISWIDSPKLSYQAKFDNSYAQADRNLAFRKALARCSSVNVIWDQTNLTKAKRKKILEEFEDYLTYAVVFDPPLEYVLDINAKRIESNKYIDPEVLKLMSAVYEPVTEDEGFIRVVNGFGKASHIIKAGNFVIAD